MSNGDIHLEQAKEALKDKPPEDHIPILYAGIINLQNSIDKKFESIEKTMVPRRWLKYAGYAILGLTVGGELGYKYIVPLVLRFIG